MSSDDIPGAARLREHHASTTRGVILRAARRLFAEYGFSGTPIRLLAKESGVAVQTIYATFGSKAGVLRSLPDTIDQEAGLYEIAEQIDHTSVPREKLALFARLRRQFSERCGDIIDSLHAGAASEPMLAETLAVGLQRRRDAVSRIIERITELGMLRENLTPGRAVDVVCAMATDEVCDSLVKQSGWSFDEYELWLSDTISMLVLRDDV